MPKLYDEETIRAGLTQVALAAGNDQEASDRLKELGTPVPRTTLQRWAEKHSDRLDEIRAEVIPQIHRRLARRNEDLADRYAALEQQMIDRLTDELPNLKPSELSTATKNLAVSKGIASEKALLLRGQPTSITKPTGADELLRKLASLLNIDSDAEEITDAEVVEVPASGRDGAEQKGNSLVARTP